MPTDTARRRVEAVQGVCSEFRARPINAMYSTATTECHVGFGGCGKTLWQHWLKQATAAQRAADITVVETMLEEIPHEECWAQREDGLEDVLAALRRLQEG